MKGDFTRFSHDPMKRYTRVLKQQGRVDLDADWNEAAEIFTHLERTEAQDVIGRCGVPEHSNGYKIDRNADGSNLTISRGRIYVNGILCSNEAPPDDPEPDAPIPITDQKNELPGYTLPDTDGVYLAYVDVWERHITYVEDPDLREVALGGPDTTTRTRTQCQVKLEPLDEDGPLKDLECRRFAGITNTGRLSAQAEEGETTTNPCLVPASAGYRGLENRLYRVEIHDDGRDAYGNQVRKPTFKWSRDNGSVVLPIAANGIVGQEVTLKRFGPDDVLSVKVGDWVEVLGDETELYSRHGTLGQIMPDGIDKANLEITLSEDVSLHQSETHLKLRRWDHHATDDVALQDGALPIQGDWFELEDGVQIRFDESATYHVGDYWVIPARTREGTVLWPKEGDIPVERRRLGIQHNYCTLALVRRVDGVWTEVRDCRNLFPPLTEIGDGACCIRVMPGEDIQQAIDTVIGAGGGCVLLCQGVHEVAGALRITNGEDVKLVGVGTPTVLRLAADAEGAGGVVVENGRRVCVENMFLVSDDVQSLIAIRHNDAWEINQRIGLRGLTLCNTAASDGETDLRSAIRLAHTEGVVVEDCRMAAEAGVVALWGNQLPDVTGQAETGEESVTTIAFEDLPLDARYQVGDSFAEDNISVRGEAFVWSNGRTTTDGYARVENRGLAGGTGQDLQTNNINLSFQLSSAFNAASLRFGFYGGNVNLRVNGELLNVNSISTLNGQIVGGVDVTVTFGPDSQELGILTLSQNTQPIRFFAIGGQELWIDDVAFRDPLAALDLTYGKGVADLFMEDTTIRFSDYGLLSATFEKWLLERCDIQGMNPDVWGDVRKRLADAASRQDYANVLGQLELLWVRPAGPQGKAVALLAFLWRDSAVRKCVLGGYHGIYATWWIRGTVQATTIVSKDAGLFAFWLHDSALTRNRITSSGGTAVAFAGSYRTRLDNNHLRGLVGIADLNFAAGLSNLSILQSAFARGYGLEGDLYQFVLFWIMTEESINLMGLRQLMDALEEQFADVLGGVPVTVFVAFLLATILSGQTIDTDDGVALPVIDLQVSHNQISCKTWGVFLKNFIPLGSLRVLGNRIQTGAGQAVRVDAYRFLANGHLAVFLYRLFFTMLLEQAEEDGGEQSGLLEVWRDLLTRWQQDSEGFLELDFRIQENTIRSLRTAIESNLFELSIVENHITMDERPTTIEQGNATIFGQVTDTAGNTLSNATVHIAGTSRAVYTGEDGSYVITGIPPGTYTLEAGLMGYTGATHKVTVDSGEQVEVNFALTEIGFWGYTHVDTSYMYYYVSNSVLAEWAPLTVGTNTEIESIAAALEDSEAFEPLAEALREGGYTEPGHYNAYLLNNDGPLADVEQRNVAADVVTAVRGLTSDPELEQTCGQLNTALRGNDRTAMQVLLPRFIRSLQGYVDSQGILAKGVGCRIVENQVIVPADVEPNTQGMGGIQVSVDLADLFITVLIATLIQQQILGGDDDKVVTLDPLLGVTETLIDNNEVIGGIGHGISIQGVAGRPDYLQDLRMRGNQIRGLAGSGIFCNENAFVVGLNIEGNHISDCGRAAGFSRVKRGLVIHTAAICHIHGNHIVRSGQGVSQSTVLGVDLDTIYGLRFTNNQLLSNGSEQALLDDGGLRLQEVYGATTLHDNVFSGNRGIGLAWVNSARPSEDALLPKVLIDGMNLYRRTNFTATQLAQEEQASVQNNVFKTGLEAALPIFKLLNLNQVNFSGNICRVGTTYGSLGEIEGTLSGIIANNMIETNANVAIDIKKMIAGIILGNNGNLPIVVSLSDQIEHGFNIPAVVIS